MYSSVLQSLNTNPRNGLLYGIYQGYADNSGTFFTTATLFDTSYGIPAKGYGNVTVSPNQLSSLCNFYANMTGFNWDISGFVNKQASIEFLGYFRPDLSGVWQFSFAYKDRCKFWFDISGTSNATNPTTPSLLTAISTQVSGSTTAILNTNSLIAGNYYPIRLQTSVNYNDGLGPSAVKMVANIWNPLGTSVSTNAKNYFFNLPGNTTW